jgi:hypothetical protein
MNAENANPERFQRPDAESIISFIPALVEPEERPATHALLLTMRVISLFVLFCCRNARCRAEYGARRLAW